MKSQRNKSRAKIVGQEGHYKIFQSALIRYFENSAQLWSTTNNLIAHTHRTTGLNIIIFNIVQHMIFCHSNARFRNPATKGKPYPDYSITFVVHLAVPLT